MANQKTTSTTMFKFISEFVRTQSKYMCIGISAIAVTIFLFFAYTLWVAQREQAAQYDFSVLMTEYDLMVREKNSQWSILLEKFEKNYEKHAKSSLLPYYLGYKASILLNQNKRDEAIVVLNKIIAAVPGSSMLPLYVMERALVQLDDADSEIKAVGLEALTNLAHDSNNIFRDSAQYYLGRYYWADNQIDSAREVWQLLVDEQHDEKMAPSPWINYVKEQLTLTIV